MINEVDALLAETLKGEFGRFFAPAEMPDITFAHPAQLQDTSKPTLALYLYEVRENTALRQDPFAFRRQPDGQISEKQRSRLRFDLTYAVTARAAEPMAEHGLLTFALGAFLRNPVVEMAAREDAECEKISISVAQPEHDETHSLRDLWRGLDRPPGPAVTLRVSAPFNPFDVDPVSLVRQAIFGYGAGKEPGHLPHPVDIRAISLSAAGRVSRKSDGKGLEGVLVSVSDRQEKSLTGPEGRYLLLNLPSGPCELVFSLRGYETARISYVVPLPGRVHEIVETDALLSELDRDGAILAARPIAPPERIAHLVEAPHEPRNQIVGRLEYPDKKPAAFVVVYLGDQSTVTDADGVYAFLPSNSKQSLVAEIPGRGRVMVKNGMVEKAAKVETKP